MDVTRRFHKLLLVLTLHPQEIRRSLTDVIIVVLDEVDQLSPSLVKDPSLYIFFPTIHGGQILQRVFSLGLALLCLRQERAYG